MDFRPATEPFLRRGARGSAGTASFSGRKKKSGKCYAKQRIPKKDLARLGGSPCTFKCNESHESPSGTKIRPPIVTKERQGWVNGHTHLTKIYVPGSGAVPIQDSPPDWGNERRSPALKRRIQEHANLHLDDRTSFPHSNRGAGRRKRPREGSEA